MVVIARQLVKYNAVFVAALLVTFSLFYFMQYLIQSDADRVQETSVFRVFDASMPKFIPIELFTIEKPEPIEVEQTDIPDIDVRTSDEWSLPSTTWVQPLVETVPPSRPGVLLSNSSMVPLIRTPPIYPTRALQRGIEGFVVVSFTVDSLGRVVDPFVVYGEPAGMFDRSALQTIVKWKYAAKIENGAPIAVQGVQQRITYELSK